MNPVNTEKSTLLWKRKLNEDRHGNSFNPFNTPFLSTLYHEKRNKENMNSHLSSHVKLGLSEEIF